MNFEFYQSPSTLILIFDLIYRLNNLVQQLRLQIVNEGCGIVPDSSDTLKELQEERRKNAELWEKYQEVLNKNKKLTCELQKSLNEHTSMIERAFIAEASKDQVEKKLCELTEECNQTIEHLKELGNKTEGSVSEEAYTSLCKMRSKILDLQSEQKQCSQMISKLTDEDDDVKTENDDSGDQSSPGDLDESSMNEKEEAHTLNQVNILYIQIICVIFNICIVIGSEEQPAQRFAEVVERKNEFGRGTVSQQSKLDYVQRKREREQK